MLATEWAKRHGHGAYSYLMRTAPCAYTTALKAARDGEGVVAEVAERISAATGGEVSVAELRYPERYKPKQQVTDDHAPDDSQGAD